MIDLVDSLREIIERHRAAGCAAAGGRHCDGGEASLSDHSRQVAQEIIARLGLRPESATNCKGTMRYVSAWFDDELTKLEGAE
jgi:hypothetical protein